MAMGWLIITLIGIATVAFMIVSPGFRITVLLLVGVLVLWFFNWIAESNKRSREYDQAMAARSNYVAEPAIKANDLSIQKMSFKNEYGEYWTLKGTVANNSERPLSALRFTVTMTDCPPTKECFIIGQEPASAELTVPADQVRAFSTGLTFKNMPATTNPRWKYELVSAR
jgi:hypothetical protein